METTSAFGSAGIFVVGLFSLFSRIGGAYNAYAALATGMLVWTAGEDGARRGVRSQFSSRC